MQMNVSLTEQLYEVVQQQVKSGRYSNASEVVRDAIRRMEREEKKEKSWQQLRDALTTAEESGRSTSSVEDVVNKVLKKNGA